MINFVLVIHTIMYNKNVIMHATHQLIDYKHTIYYYNGAYRLPRARRLK